MTNDVAKNAESEAYPMPTVRDIVREWLVANGMDGLETDTWAGWDDHCSCVVDDLMPCCENPGIIDCHAFRMKGDR